MRDCESEGFHWIVADDASQSVFAWLRWGFPNDPPVAAICNFTPQPRHGYRIGLPFTGRWRELLNTDASEYGGSGLGNLGSVEAAASPSHGMPASATLLLPPLATSYSGGTDRRDKRGCQFHHDAAWRGPLRAVAGIGEDHAEFGLLPGCHLGGAMGDQRIQHQKGDHDVPDPDRHRPAGPARHGLCARRWAGSRLMELTDRRAKPAVYFGGKLRIIDFALSNALNSGIRRMAVATHIRRTA